METEAAMDTSLENTSAAQYSDYIMLGDPGQLQGLFEAVVYITGISGCFTNLFVMIVLFKSGRFTSRPGSLLLINQTVVDLFTSVMVLLTYITWFSGVSYSIRDNLWGRLHCHLLHNEVLLYIGFYSNAFNISWMAGERYLMVVFPVIHRNTFTCKKAYLLIAVAWIMSILLNIPSAAATYITDVPYCYYDIILNATYNMIHGFFVMTLTYFLPMIFVVYAYSHMAYVLKSLSSKRMVQVHPQNPATQGATGSRKKEPVSKSQVNLLKVMAVITIIYILTWTPIQLYYFMYNLGMPLSFSDAYYYIGTSLAIVNSSVNPFIYFFKYSVFKASARKLLGLKCTQGNVGESSHEGNNISADRRVRATDEHDASPVVTQC